MTKVAAPAKTPLPYTVPPLYLPVPVTPHPQGDEVVRRIEAWLTETGLFDVPEYRRVYRDLCLGDLFNACHPTGSVEGLAAIAPAYILGFFADNPQSGDEHASAFLQGLTGGLLDLTPEQAIALLSDPGMDALLTDPLARAFLTANRTLQAWTSPEKYSYYITRFLEWFRAESSPAAAGRLPTLDEALTHRRTSVGSRVVAAYMAAAYPDLTAKDANSAEAVTIWELAIITTAMQNDLYSGYTDLYADGKPRHPADTSGNVIPAFAREYDLTMQQAVQRVAALADRAADEALRRIDTLARQGAPDALIDYLNCGLAYPAAALPWYPKRMKTRYRSPGLDLSSVGMILAVAPAATGAPGIASIDHLWATAP